MPLGKRGHLRWLKKKIAISCVTCRLTADISADSSKEKEKLILVVASGKSKQFLGKLMTTADIETLSDEDVQKLYARYEAVLGLTGGNCQK